MNTNRLDNVLRPQTFDDFTGQKTIADNIKIYIKASYRRNEPLDHVIMAGPPGTGKTTMAQIIANELKVKIRTISGPVLEKPEDLFRLMRGIKDKEICFIDEVHAIPRIVEEYLYSAMEDYKLDLNFKDNAKPKRIKIGHFTLVGTTTRLGLLSKPFLDRFDIQCSFELYSVPELSDIIKRTARIMRINITGVAVELIAQRSRGTPRVANRILKRIRDIASVNYNQNLVSETIASDGLARMGIDEAGLDIVDRKILQAIADAKKPLGLKTLASMVYEEQESIEERYEPFLMREGYLIRSPRGREITAKAFEHLTKLNEKEENDGQPKEGIN